MDSVLKRLYNIRHRILRWAIGSGQITGINTGEDWDKAAFDSVMIHWIMKEPLRRLIRMLPDVPDHWLDQLTGSRKLLYEICKEQWYDNGDNRHRLDKMWKPFLYFIVIWQFDEMMEFVDKVLLEVLRRRDDFYINGGRQFPGLWYMDHNPKFGGSGGRAMNILTEDPDIRYDTLYADDVIVLVEQPKQNFVCRTDLTGNIYYSVLDRTEYIRTTDGGYAYAIKDTVHDLVGAAMKGAEIEQEKKR